MRLAEKLSKKRLQILVLYISTLSGTLLGVLSSVLNTHFLNPSDYGDVRYVQNFAAYIASFLLFGYFLSGSRLLAINESLEKRRAIKGAMVIILAVASIILMIGVLICSIAHYQNPKISNLFLLAIPVCFFPLFQSYILNTAQGDNQISRIVATNVLPYLLYIIFGYLLYKYTGATSEKMLLLQWGIFSFVMLCVIISTQPKFKNWRLNFTELNNENKAYGIQLYWGSLVMIGSNYIAGITLGLFNNDNVNVGYYTLALSVSAPLIQLPAIVGTSYFREFSQQNVIPFKVFKSTILVALSSCVLYILFIKQIVIFLYAPSYAQVGDYASLLAIGFTFHGVGDMLNKFLQSHGIGKPIRNSSFVCGTIKLIGFTLFVYLWNIDGAILANILGSIAYFLTLFIYYKRNVNTRLEL